MKTIPAMWTLLFVSSMTTAHAGDGFPPFSWGSVPVYAHFGIGTGLEPEDYDFVAEHFDFVGLTAGVVKRGDTCEPYMGKGAREIKKRNPDAKVLFYWCPCQRKGAWTLFNADFPENGFMPDGEQFDVTRQDVRDWWTGWAAKAAHEFSCDGLFLDGLCAGQPGFLWSRRYGDEKAAQMDKAGEHLLKLG